jgi:hypothetical protein
LVKVTFRPWEEVVIHESIRYNLEDLVRQSSIGVQPGGLAPPLQWAEGVAFRAVTMPPTDDVVKENLTGKVHWGAVQWALMPKYQLVIPISDINAKIPIIDVSANTILCDVAKALKESVKS